MVFKIYFFRSFAYEFLFFFSVFFCFSLMVSAMRYSVDYGRITAGVLIPSSIFFLPLFFIFAYHFASLNFLKTWRKKTKYLDVFGNTSIIFRTMMLVSILICSMNLLFAFYISPMSFRVLTNKMIKIYNPEYRRSLDSYIFILDDNIIVARKIYVEDEKITADEGFIFDGRRNIYFSGITLTLPYATHRFGKELAELIADGGEEERKEIIYYTSLSISAISCTPFYFMWSVYSIACPIASFFASKLMRDSLSPILFLLFMLFKHIIFFVIGYIFKTMRSFH